MKVKTYRFNAKMLRKIKKRLGEKEFVVYG